MKELKYALFFLVSTLFILTSCRTEETLVIDPPKKNTILSNSKVASLMQRVALKDGSTDNIIDKANCIAIKFPVTITVNGKEIVITTEDNYDDIEDIFDESEDDIDSIVVSYPIEAVFSDYTIQTINSDIELTEIIKNCKGENEEDEDIECIDFMFPFKISSYNQNNELVNTIIIENDNQLYNFIKRIKDFTLVTISFPIRLILIDGSIIEIENIEDLEEVIENADNSCDEDDDYNYNDDDCNDCTIDKLKEVFETKSEFNVDKLKINEINLNNNYLNYLFSFKTDGTLEVFNDGNQHTGTWEASGSGNDLFLVINISDLPDFNNSWRLHELKTESNKIEINLKKEEDKLTFI